MRLLPNFFREGRTIRRKKMCARLFTYLTTQFFGGPFRRRGIFYSSFSSVSFQATYVINSCEYDIYAFHFVHFFPAGSPGGGAVALQGPSGGP